MKIFKVYNTLSERVNELPAPVLSGRRLQAEFTGGVAPSTPLRGCLPLRSASGTMSRDALLPPPTGMISVLDRAFKGEL